MTAMSWMLVHNMCVVNGERVHVANGALLLW